MGTTISLRPCYCQFSLFYIVVSFCLDKIWFNWTWHDSNLVLLLYPFLLVVSWAMTILARIKQHLHLTVGGSWCCAWLKWWNQTKPRLGLSPLLQGNQTGALVHSRPGRGWPGPGSWAWPHTAPKSNTPLRAQGGRSIAIAKYTNMEVSTNWTKIFLPAFVSKSAFQPGSRSATKAPNFPQFSATCAAHYAFVLDHLEKCAWRKMTEHMRILLGKEQKTKGDIGSWP